MSHDAIRRPEWHNCPAFDYAWEGLRSIVTDPRQDDVSVSAALGVARLMGDARVIKMELEQVRAVQSANARFQVGDFAPRLPHDPLFIEMLGTAKREGYCVSTIEDGRVSTIPCFGMERDGARRCLIGFECLLDSGYNDDDKRHGEVRLWNTAFRGDPELRQEGNQACGRGVQILRSLLLLLFSANVELDGEPLPRQQARDAGRKGREIPLAIKIRHGHRKPIPRGGPARSYSHSFEVRPHPQYHARGAVFDYWSKHKPHLVFEHPERGPCVQVWHPGAVKGSGVFVPKVRDARDLAA